MTRIDDVAKTLSSILIAPHLTDEEHWEEFLQLAHALDDDGHLMPDLPEPDTRTWTDPHWWPAHGLNYGHVRRGDNTVTIARGDVPINLTPDEAKELGLFLLAAAHHGRTKE